MKTALILAVHSVDPEKLFSSIPHRPTREKWFVHFHGPNPDLKDTVASYLSQREAAFHPHMVNRGLARSWNDAIEEARNEGCENFLLLNDDLFFYEGGFASFIETIERVSGSNHEVATISPNGFESGMSPHSGEIHNQGFACCALTTAAINRIGYFDETFWPAYFEDVDYATRMRKVGLTAFLDERVLVEHERSSTLRQDEVLRRSQEQTFRRNETYFLRKWGSMDPARQHAVPFGVEGTTNYISAHDRRRIPQIDVSPADEQS